MNCKMINNRLCVFGVILICVAMCALMVSCDRISANSDGVVDSLEKVDTVNNTTASETTAPGNTKLPLIAKVNCKSTGFVRTYSNHLMGTVAERYIKVFSKESLDAILIPGILGFDDTVTNEYYPQSLKDICDKYDSKFFENNSLIYYELPVSNPVYVKIKEIRGDGKTLKLDYEIEHIDRSVSPETKFYGFVLELPKSLLNEDTKLELSATYIEALKDGVDYSYSKFVREYTNEGNRPSWSERPIKVFSKEELDAILIPGLYGFDDTVTNEYYSQSLKDICDKYDEEYFKFNALLYFEVRRDSPIYVDVMRLRSDEFNHLELVYEVEYLNKEVKGEKIVSGFVLEISKMYLNERTVVDIMDEFHPDAK